MKENVRRKKWRGKMEEHKKGRKIKINLKSINYFYILLRTYFTYFHFPI